MVPGGDPREAGLRAAQLGQATEQNGDLVQAINLYRQSICYLEQAGAPEAGQVLITSSDTSMPASRLANCCLNAICM